LFHENTQTLYKFGCDKKTKAVSKAASRDCEGGTTKACLPAGNLFAGQR